jgi:hypothetical protein
MPKSATNIPPGIGRGGASKAEQQAGAMNTRIACANECAAAFAINQDAIKCIPRGKHQQA